MCVPTNNGVEVCDGVDNNCNGTADEGADVSSVAHCGACNHDCLAQSSGFDRATVACVDGGAGFVCVGSCAPGYYNRDNNPSDCEVYCVATAPDDVTCDQRDDDCDGSQDEDVDLCASTQHCGVCNRPCAGPHATYACVPTAPGACTAANTTCTISQCTCNGPGDCWVDVDQNPLNGCEVPCLPSNNGVEVCDGLDNDCDGRSDAVDDLTADGRIGVTCQGGVFGTCADPARAGLTACAAAQVVCLGPNVVRPYEQPETCDALDNDCNGLLNDNPVDTGMACGLSGVFPCARGTIQCINNAPLCVGHVDPQQETCNGVDDDCDGEVDQTGGLPPEDSVGACLVPVPPPAGATSPCRAGLKSCLTGGVVCLGAVVAPVGVPDACGEDSNCDGTLQGQPDLANDPNHCGQCGNSCSAGSVHAIRVCINRTCTFLGCERDYYETVPGSGVCDRACVFTSAQEMCNGRDDNCDGNVDEGVVVPTPQHACGVSPLATAPECTSGVGVQCVNGAWQCTFTSGVCNPTCANATELCDTLDNNCNGLVNENTPLFGRPCASDDGLPAPGHGKCRTQGTYACASETSVACTAVKGDCATLPGGCTEVCDGEDNDCDGLTDESFNNKGSNPEFTAPVVTRVASSLWMYTYEASRPTATITVAGLGNGFHTSAPAGSTLDKTRACSVPDRVPWFSVSPREVEQVCVAMGGAVCTTTQWAQACQAKTGDCTHGYNPAGVACLSSYSPTTFCNLGPSYDFLPAVAGDQDGLLPTASSTLSNCWADWSATLGNVEPADALRDITGNLREITASAPNQYRLMGGAFDSQSESGSTCTFDFYSVDMNFSFFDTGFRCCFTQDPTL